MSVVEQEEAEVLPVVDPRALLAEWANANDEWIRYVAAEVISASRAMDEASLDQVYSLFRQEKALDERTLPIIEQLSTDARQDETAEPLTLLRLSDVRSVNALVPGAIIEPHEGLTILFGENGTGKTGYSRIFKALADSRTADVILGDIGTVTGGSPSATLKYRVGDQEQILEWTGEQGISPFTRMSIFDSPSVNYHVDEDLDYVYVPASLALFRHVIAGIQAVGNRIDSSIAELASSSSALLSRFPKRSTVYPVIETLGASTDLEALKAKRNNIPKVDEKLDALRRAIAALEANAIAPQLALHQREGLVLEQASRLAAPLNQFDDSAYNQAVEKREELARDYVAFRRQLFLAVDLPAEPETTWEAFIAAGEVYRNHLIEVDAHEVGRCLYCRQSIMDPARELLTKYSAYLEDKISIDLKQVDNEISAFALMAQSIPTGEVAAYMTEFSGKEAKPSFYEALQASYDCWQSRTRVTTARTVSTTDVSSMAGVQMQLEAALVSNEEEMTRLRELADNRTAALKEMQAELTELTAAAELAKSWTTIEDRVRNAKEADRLRILKTALPKLSKGVTELSKSASDQLINQSFDALFLEECEALRTPAIKLQFVGREGKAQRRKVLTGKYKPSKVLSEGEQKVLAMADFLAEARLAGIAAPVIFDDPVSSLDHRRINEVAQRIANLSRENQVIVFTHDIFFATTLLSLFEESKRCNYFQITDEDGKGKVARATGPRWDTLGSIRAKINLTIEDAKRVDGEARDALVRVGYGWIRSWCEVFVETELLQGVTQRYQPNVGMTKLPKIRTEKLADPTPRVTAIFEEACRYIDGHSQTLPTLGLRPTLAGIGEHWKSLQECKKAHDAK